MLAVLRGKRGKIAVAGAAALAVALGGGGVAYATLKKSVTLTVDGQTEQVSAFAGTVGELLEDRGLEVGARDIVAPATSSRLQDGDTVVVRYARPLTLTIDGTQRIHWTTETSVERALSAIGVRFDNASMSASRSARIARSGLALSLSTPKQVVFTIEGKARPVTTTAPTVADFLREQKLDVRPQDQLSAVPTTPVTNGLKLTLVKVDTKRVTVTEAVDFRTEKRENAKLYKGETKVVTKGRKGARVAVYELTLTDGKESDKKLLSARVLQEPVTQVVQVGTKARPSSGGGGNVGGGVDSLNWDALAKCESGGNPKAVNSAGPYYGLYQFSASTWRSVGGTGVPTDHGAAEQTYRAKLLYKKAGRGQWPHCGKYL